MKNLLFFLFNCCKIEYTDVPLGIRLRDMIESGTEVETLLDIITKQEQIIKKLEESIEIMHSIIDNRNRMIKVLEFELKYTKSE